MDGNKSSKKMCQVAHCSSCKKYVARRHKVIKDQFATTSTGCSDYKHMCDECILAIYEGRKTCGGKRCGGKGGFCSRCEPAKEFWRKKLTKEQKMLQKFTCKSLLKTCVDYVARNPMVMLVAAGSPLSLPSHIWKMIRDALPSYTSSVVREQAYAAFKGNEDMFYAIGKTFNRFS